MIKKNIIAFMRTNPDQVATIDIGQLQKHVKNNPIDSSKQYRGLSNLVSTAYVRSLADLHGLQTDLNKALQERNMQAVGQMKEKYAKLLDTCFDDLCTWCKSAFDDEVHKALEQSRNQTWPERIRIYQSEIEKLKTSTRQVNSVFNENLIIPAMDFAYKQFEMINQVDVFGDQNQLEGMQDRNIRFQAAYESNILKLKQRQESQTKLDLDERDGFVIRNNDQYIRIQEGYGSDAWKNKLQELGLSRAQIDFITSNCNQSGITAVAPGIMPAAKPCANLVVDIQSQAQGRPKVLLRSVAYNNGIYMDNPAEPTIKYLGIAQLSIDISSLGAAEKYVPGTHKGVKMSLSSDFFHNEEARLINNQDFGIPLRLLTKFNHQKFQRDYENFGEGYLKSLTATEVLDKLPSNKFLEVQQGYIAARLFTHNNTLDTDFYHQAQQEVNDQNPRVTKETLDKAVADSVVSNVSKLISSELENLDNNNQVVPNNPRLGNENRKRVTNNIYESIRGLIPPEAEKVVKQTISKLVLDVAYDKDVRMDLRQKVELWWNKVVDFITLKSKTQGLSQQVKSSRAIQNNRHSRSDSNSRSL